MNKEKELPKVTVVTVVYNLIKNEREQYFRQCLKSVHDQSYPNVEHIVMDGASDDGTIDLLEEHHKKGWIQYYSEPDKGIYDAMNKGVKKSSGKYIIFLNSDDFFHNEKAIAVSVKKLEEDQTDFSCGIARIINNEAPVALGYPLIEFFMFFTPCCHQTILMKRDVFIKEHGFNYEKYKVLADYDLIVRAILKGYRLSIVNEVLVSFRLGGFSSKIHEETEILQKEYFSKLVEDRSSANEYIININELKKVSSMVCDTIKKSLSKLNYKKIGQARAKVTIKKYWYPLVKIYKIFGIPLFSSERLEISIYSKRKTYRLFSIKLFEKKTTPTEDQYRILYIPVLTVKHFI